MSNERELAALLSSLQSTLKLQSTLLVRFEDRETEMRLAFEQRMQALQSEIALAQRRIDAVVGQACTRIAENADEVLRPMAVKHDQVAVDFAARMSSAGRMVWTWFGASAAIVLLVLLVMWLMLSHYRGELAVTKEELHRYEDALPVLRAFYASDAVICGERICSNADPDGQRVGERLQYRQAMSRPPP